MSQVVSSVSRRNFSGVVQSSSYRNLLVSFKKKTTPAAAVAATSSNRQIQTVPSRPRTVDNIRFPMSQGLHTPTKAAVFRGPRINVVSEDPNRPVQAMTEVESPLLDNVQFAFAHTKTVEAAHQPMTRFLV